MIGTYYSENGPNEDAYASRIVAQLAIEKRLSLLNETSEPVFPILTESPGSIRHSGRELVLKDVALVERDHISKVPIRFWPKDGLGVGTQGSDLEIVSNATSALFPRHLLGDAGVLLALLPAAPKIAGLQSSTKMTDR